MQLLVVKIFLMGCKNMGYFMSNKIRVMENVSNKKMID
jgi:hypothetical protein